MEKHSGTREHSERFGGETFLRIKSVRSKSRAEEEKGMLQQRGYMVRVEPDGPGHFNVYGKRGRGR